MANVLWPKAKQSFLTANPPIDMDSDTIKVSLVRGYTYNSAHQYVSDVTGASGTLVATATLGTITCTNGVFDAADVTFSAVASGAACNMLIIYKDTGTASSSPLVASIDTASGLPVTPVGVDIAVTWDNGASKIFAL